MLPSYVGVLCRTCQRLQTSVHTDYKYSVFILCEVGCEQALQVLVSEERPWPLTPMQVHLLSIRCVCLPLAKFQNLHIRGGIPHGTRNSRTAVSCSRSLYHKAMRCNSISVTALALTDPKRVSLYRRAVHNIECLLLV